MKSPATVTQSDKSPFQDKPKKNGHIITVLLHDYFHRGVFKQCIGEKQWNRFESRLDKNVDDTLELLSIQ